MDVENPEDGVDSTQKGRKVIVSKARKSEGGRKRNSAAYEGLDGE